LSNETEPRVLVQNPNALVWLRRDLRINDNGALERGLEHALARNGRVIPVFVLDPTLLKRASPNRLGFLYGALRALRTSGLPLRVISGDPAAAIVAAAKEFAADVFVASDAGPYGRLRDAAVRHSLGAQHELVEADSPYLVHPGTVRKSDDTPYKVFTPFSKVWLTYAQSQRSVNNIGVLQQFVASESVPLAELGVIPSNPNGMPAGLPVPSEQAAHEAASGFLQDRMYLYDQTRNDPAADATSRLGAYLKYGLLHPRQLMRDIELAVQQNSDGARVFRTELCWREFYADVLWHRPDSARENYVVNVDVLTDSGALADERFEQWCAGQTGFPFIDAGMRQLMAQGWMHNRVRMAAASFLVKDLHLPWQRGAAWFMKHLVDGDLASNQHGWQWTAGTGTDASPYFRVFNPTSQGKKFDPDGTYVRRWVPELASVPTKFIHEPWLMAPSSRAELPLLLDPAVYPALDRAVYPGPIVDHAAEREESLRRYGLTRA
jgi:deoxyribodipyrimidine photo-lyase